jgi:hypothetical protein
MDWAALPLTKTAAIKVKDKKEVATIRAERKRRKDSVRRGRVSR